MVGRLCAGLSRILSEIERTQPLCLPPELPSWERSVMVTMDYLADRVTVHLDAANRVEHAVCT